MSERHINSSMDTALTTPAPASHRRRTVRWSPVALHLAERDHWLLEALGKLRFATTGQLLRLGFANTRSVASKRLRRLFDAGLVNVWVRCLEAENVYSLTLAGRSVLAGTSNGHRVHVARGLDRDLDHTLAVNDVRIALATMLPALGAELTSWLSDWDLRPRGVSRRLVPDAQFTIRWSTGAETACNLEVDRRTQSTTAVLRKLMAYRAAMYRQDRSLVDSNPLILVVAHSSDWCHSHRNALRHAALRIRAWFTTRADLIATGAAGLIWRTADDDQPYALSTLAALRNGSAGYPSETAAATSAYALNAARVPPVPTA
jgi:hypothetical protein